MIDCVFLGDWGTLPDNRLCYHEQIHAGEAGIPERFCQTCPHRQPRGNSPPPPTTLQRSPRYRRAHPCQHLGQPTGEVRDCAACGGSRQVPVNACAIHGRCTTESLLICRDEKNEWVQLPLCLGCLDYRPGD